MLEGLDTISWDKLIHAYGMASDVPQQIRALAAKDVKVCEQALSDLYSNIWHQGTVFEAAAYAVPFLIELIEQPGIHNKEWLLVYLGVLARGNSYSNVHQSVSIYDNERDKPEFKKRLQRELEWVQAAHAAVRNGCSVYAHLLHQESSQVRATAAYLLGLFPENAEQNVNWLRPHIASDERDEVVRAACVFAIGMLAIKEQAAVNWLKEVIDSNAPFSIRISAALGLARAIPDNAPEQVRNLLTEAVCSPGSTKAIFDQFPWFDSDVQTYCSDALMLVGGTSTKLLPALLKALEEVTPFESWGVVRSILFLVFDGKPMLETMTSKRLSDDQRIALQAIANSKEFWTGFFNEGTIVINVTRLMEFFGLPQTPSKLQAFLDGKLTPRDKEWSTPM